MLPFNETQKLLHEDREKFNILVNLVIRKANGNCQYTVITKLKKIKLTSYHIIFKNHLLFSLAYAQFLI